MYFKKLLVLFFFSLLSYSFGQNSFNNNSSYLHPVKLEAVKNFYQLGNVYMGGQPDSSELAWFVEQGVDKIINLRREKENKKFAKKEFSMAKAAKSYGIKYESIPIGGKDGYKPEDVEVFAKAISDTNLTYLVHCKGGTRANYMWIAYLANYKQIPLNDAVEACKKMEIKFHFEKLLGYPIKIEKL